MVRGSLEEEEGAVKGLESQEVVIVVRVVVRVMPTLENLGDWWWCVVVVMVGLL